MKSLMPEITGNQALIARLSEDILSGRLAHAYIIEGKKGTGRHLLAKNIAKAIACENSAADGLPFPCDSCVACQKIEKQICPDVVMVSREKDKASVGVDTIRFLKADVYVVPNDLDVKIYVIEEADKMTDAAQNALLLTLEEPPSYAIFLLICEQADLLLETVRSRAPIIRTESLSAELVSEHLLKSAPDELASEARYLFTSAPSDFSEIIAASGGSIGKAYSLLDPKKRASTLELRRRVRDFVSAVIAKKSFESVFDAVSDFSNKREELTVQLELVRLALRDLILLKKSESVPLCFYSDRELAFELSDSRPIAFLLRFCSACEEAIDAIRKNANVKLTLTRLANIT